jgi:hypothetical protein
MNHTCKNEKKERKEENIKLHINLRCCTRISVHVMKASHKRLGGGGSDTQNKPLPDRHAMKFQLTDVVLFYPE